MSTYLCNPQARQVTSPVKVNTHTFHTSRRAVKELTNELDSMLLQKSLTAFDVETHETIDYYLPQLLDEALGGLTVQSLIKPPLL